MVCCVWACQSGSTADKGPKYTLYKFAESPWLRKQWIIQINRENFTPTKSSVVCSKHFAEDAFEPKMVGSQGRKIKRRRLLPKAIPTLFLRPSHLSDESGASPSVQVAAAAPTPTPSATAPTTKGDHSYSAGGDENDGEHCPPDSMVQNEVIVSGSDIAHEEPAKQQIPPKTSCRECIDKDTNSEALLARIEQLEREKAEYKQVVEKLETIWNKDMVRKMMKPSTSTVHYSTKTILECILIYYRVGTTAYEMFRDNGYPYPSLSTLKNHLRQVDCEPGILDDFFIFMKNQLDNLEEHEKYSILNGDEMAIKPGIEYNTTTQEYVGTPTMSKAPANPRNTKKRKKPDSAPTPPPPPPKKAKQVVGGQVVTGVVEPLDEDDIPNLSEEEDVEELEEDPVTIDVPEDSQTTADSKTEPKKLSMAVHAMSFMLCGITKRWKNIIGFHFTESTFCAKECAEFYRQLIRKSYEAGSKVKALTMDMSGQNMNI